MAEEKGYWFSTENGTHIHAEEGESKEQAMGKKFKNFKKEKSSLNFPKPTKEEHQETLDKEIKDSFKNREEGLKYLESQTNDWSDEEKESLKKRIDRVYPEDKKEEPGLKVESRSIINEKQANDPRVLADKLDDKEEVKEKQPVEAKVGQEVHDIFSREWLTVREIKDNGDIILTGPETLYRRMSKAEFDQMYNASDLNEMKPVYDAKRQLTALYNKAKENNLSFERMVLNDIKNNPDKYNEFILGNKQYKRNGNAFDMYEDGKHVSTGTYNSVASDVNKYYEKDK